MDVEPGRRALGPREEQDTAVGSDIVYQGRGQPAGLGVATLASGDCPQVAEIDGLSRGVCHFCNIEGASAGVGVFDPQLFQRISERIQHRGDRIDHGRSTQVNARVVDQYQGLGGHAVARGGGDTARPVNFQVSSAGILSGSYSNM